MQNSFIRVTFYCPYFREVNVNLWPTRSALRRTGLLGIAILSAVAASAAAPWNLPRFSAGAKELYTAASRPSPPEGADVIVLDEEESYVFDAKGRTVYTEYMVYKILSQEGVQGWDSLAVYWQPWRGPRPSIRGRVITPDFVEHDLDLKTESDSPVQQDEQSNVYSNDRVLRAPLPAVGPGSVIETEIEIKTRPLFPTSGTMGVSMFGKVSIPVQHRLLTLEAPSRVPLRYVTRLLPHLQPQRVESGGHVRLVFEEGPIAPLHRSDSYLPGNVAAYPMVAFSTGTSWQEVAKGYAKIVDSQIKTADLKPLVGQIFQGKRSRDEEIAALAEYVDKQIRYTGIEFGDAAVVPHTPKETLLRRYGDCKDVATLLVALLRTAGIPADVALLNAGRRLDLSRELPGLGFFDHAIVYVPDTPELWIDPTDRYSRPGQLPISDQGRLALVAQDETQGLVRIPEAPSQDNVLLESREVDLAEYGPARVIETSRPRGVFESEYRRIFANEAEKDAHTHLLDYMKSQYLAKKLDRVTQSDPFDFSKPFELVLESDKAKRGFTDLDEAVVAIGLGNLFHRLPAPLRESSEEESKNEGEESREKTRTADYQLPEAFIQEWHYKIVPPAGFQAGPLPPDAQLSLGPARLQEQFKLDASGSVHATFRFDTVKRRFTVSEAKELRNQVVHLSHEQPILIHFQPVGKVLADQGKMRQAIQSYRNLIALHPQEAVLHLRLAEALLNTGLGGTARAEARAAVKLEPHSALAEKTLAGILEHDLVGRNRRPGSDYAGAVAAFRAAEKLDPDDKTTVANLAILLEFNRWGLRYGPGAKLNEALAEYHKLTPSELEKMGLQANVAFAEFYDGKFARAQKDAESLNPRPTALIGACEAILKGSQAALAEIRQLTANDEEFKNIAETSGDLMVKLRRYSLAADLEDAGASGSSASDTEAYAALYRQTRPHEQIHFPDSPAGAALRFTLLQDDPHLPLDQLKAICSRNGKTVIATSAVRDELVKEEKASISEKSRKGEFEAVGVDLSITRAQPSVQGSDAVGYKVILWPSASYQQSVYIVKQDGQYKVLATSRYPAGIGLEVLDRLSKHDLKGARQLLDWLRDDQHLKGGDDPLAGLTFPRFWTKGETANPRIMKLAAASILTQWDKTAAQGVAILAAARRVTRSETLRTNITLALVHGYGQMEKFARELAMCRALARTYPESKRVFIDETFCLRALGRVQEAERLTRERLKRLPGDLEAMRVEMWNAEHLGDYSRAHAVGQKMIAGGNAGADDLNGAAWQSLFTGKIDASDIQDALRAAQLEKNDFPNLHTLACLLAAVGRVKEAHDVLLQAMDAGNFDEPDDNCWYVLGLIAEQCGERAAAIADYSRLSKPKRAFDIPDSTYLLAQMRLKALQAASK